MGHSLSKQLTPWPEYEGVLGRYELVRSGGGYETPLTHVFPGALLLPGPVDQTASSGWIVHPVS